MFDQTKLWARLGQLSESCPNPTSVTNKRLSTLMWGRGAEGKGQAMTYGNDSGSPTGLFKRAGGRETI